MIRIILALSLSLILNSTTFGQLEFGFKLGASTSDVTSENPESTSNGINGINKSLLNSEYGLHLGVYSRLSILGFFVEPTLLVNTSSLAYTLDHFNEGLPITTLKKTRFNSLDIPLMIGMNILAFNMYAGPVAHIPLSDSSVNQDIPSFINKYEESTFSWQAGVGVDLLSLRLRVSYENNLSLFGRSLNVGGNSLQLAETPSRLIFSLGIKL